MTPIIIGCVAGLVILALAIVALACSQSGAMAERKIKDLNDDDD